MRVSTPLRPLVGSVWQYVGPETVAQGQLQVVVSNLPEEVITIPFQHEKYPTSECLFRGVATVFFERYAYVGQKGEMPE